MNLCFKVITFQIALFDFTPSLLLAVYTDIFC